MDNFYELPPNGHGLAAVLAVNLVMEYDLAAMSEADRLHVMIECMRLGSADAQQWVCDPRVRSIPLAKLLRSEYANRRRQRVDMGRAAQQVPYGDPIGGGDTVYLSVADGEGNACSFINRLFMGTGVRVRGWWFLVRGQLAESCPALLTRPAHPNALEPNKRPYPRYIPAMTIQEGKLHASFGVMGGYMQPQGHFQMLVNMVDLGMTPQQALDVSRWRIDAGQMGIGAEEPGGLVHIEEGWSFETMAELTKRGHRLASSSGFDRSAFGGGQIIQRNPELGILIGGSDPRKDGCVVEW